MSKAAKEVRKNTPMGDRPGACPQKGGYRRAWISALATCAVALCSRVALAAPHDDAAKKLIQKAMYEDYVGTNFADAGKELEQALALCQAATDCAPTVRARVLLDLGVVEFVLQRPDEGRAHFARSVQEDPKIALEPDFSTPDLVKEFAAAHAGAPAEKAEPAAQEPAVPPEAATPPAPKGSADCPPNFPGCAATPASCTSNSDCSEGTTCVDGSCSASDTAVEDEKSKPYKKNWVSLAFQEDFLFLPGATDACRGGAKYSCFDAGTSNYDSTDPRQGVDDSVVFGQVPATMEILAGYDRALTRNFQLGVRLGYVLGGGPQRPGGAAFVPVHAEGRLTYWVGKNPLARKGFRFYLLLASGIGEVDGKFTIAVDRPSILNPNTFNTATTNDDAWTKTGTGFVAFGPALMYAITPVTGVFLEAKIMEMFPTIGTGFGLQLGYSYGF